MNPSATAIGPLVVPTPLLILLGCGAIAVIVARIAARHKPARIGGTLLDMLVAAALAGRLVFVVSWFAQYRNSPWSILDVRDGGFTPWAGLGVAAVVALWQGWRRPPLRQPLVLGLFAAALGWIAAPGALRFGAQPTLVDLDAALKTASPNASASLERLAAGKPTVVNLWATWCPPCRREMPVLAEAEHRLDSVTFVFANQGEDVFTVQHYLEANQLQLGNVLLDPDKAIGRKYGSMALPTTLFYDAQGRLVEAHMGALSAATLASKLSQLQAGEPVSSR